MTVDVIDPVSGDKVKKYEGMSSKDVSEILAKVNQAWEGWERTLFEKRSRLMHKAADILRSRKKEYARVMALEMGKPVSAGESEAEKCAWVCDYYADNAEAFLSRETVETDASNSFIAFQPLGIVLAVMPWNFPFWQVFRFAAPALMAGNAGVLKHASNVPGCALAIEEIFREAGFPANLFRTLIIDSKAVEEVIRDPRICAVTLTGSTPAGKSVASIAGSELKKSVLELGGSDPYVILEDAHIEEAARICSTSRMINAGQSCIAAKRFIVVDKVYDTFVKAMVDEMDKYKTGDPMDDDTRLGPMARQDLRDELHEQVIKSIEHGAECLLGGTVPDKKGAWYYPTVLTQVKPGMPAYDEELFGPVAAIIKAEDEKEAIRIANDTSFGLGAAIFTADSEKGERIATEELEAGCCFVNDFVKSDPRLPFGGIKQSGYGRELSKFGIREFVNIKSVYVK